MKNVTISLDEETHRQARIRAAELGTSLSALVRDYLRSLSATETPVHGGVREMPMAYGAPPLEQKKDGPPWLVDGKWVYTRDGKPRQPGALRGMTGWTEDFDEWPDGFLDALQGEDTDAAKNWYKKSE